MATTVVDVERVIAAPAARIFELLADASKHPLIDGSGTLSQSATAAPEPLGLGSVFGMPMRLGIPYRMVNEVVEFEQDRRIAWRPKLSGPLGRVVRTGRIWRYTLEPIDAGRTKVTETWDISNDALRPALSRGFMPEQTRKNMEKTLARIAELVAAE